MPDGRGDQGGPQGKLEARDQRPEPVGASEVIQGQGVVHHQDLGEGPEEDDAETHQNHRRGDGRQSQHGIEDVRGDRPPFRLLGFAADGGVGLPLEEILVDHEDDQARQHQKNAEDGGHFQVVVADPQQIGPRGEEGNVPADQHGISEIGDGEDENEERRLQNPRGRQRDGDLAEDLPVRGAHVTGGLLQVGAQGAQNVFDHQISQRQEGDHLGDDHPPPAVDVERQLQHPRHDAVTAADDDQGQRKDERRRHQRDEAEQPQGELQQSRSIEPQEGKAEGERNHQQRGDDRHDDAVFQRPVITSAGKEIHVGGEACRRLLAQGELRSQDKRIQGILVALDRPLDVVEAFEIVPVLAETDGMDGRPVLLFESDLLDPLDLLENQEQGFGRPFLRFHPRGCPPERRS